MKERVDLARAEDGRAVIELPDTGAIFNADRTRRHWLGRKLDVPGYKGRVLLGRLLIIGCNPSNADEHDNDPTIVKEMKFARRWGYERLDKVNVFDWCATDPTELPGVAQPASDENEGYILAAITRVMRQPRHMVLCAWGRNAALLARGARTKRLLLATGARLFCLRLNKDGSPQHPLYISDDAVPSAWT